MAWWRFLKLLGMESIYDDTQALRAMVKAGRHREVIGGLWEEMGKLQLDFLREHGLRPTHQLLDLGCGSLRAGTQLIPYLDPGHYWGVDISADLLEAGWEELGALGLQQRQPRGQLVALADFEFNQLATRWDYCIAASVFTHMTLNRIRRCLARLAGSMSSDGRFFATFFECPREPDRETERVHAPGGVVTYSWKDPYHYKMADFHHLVSDLPWNVELIGPWDHPRGQHMLLFRPTGGSSPAELATSSS
jgi:cyclopropane fatty-acyl-phospholipid synthase-like methyltransferase